MLDPETEKRRAFIKISKKMTQAWENMVKAGEAERYIRGFETPEQIKMIAEGKINPEWSIYTQEYLRNWWELIQL